MDKNANFVVFPQGVLLNFLTRRTTPIPYDTFMFAEVTKFGEEEMLRSLKGHKPDFIVLSNQELPIDHDPRRKYPHIIRAWILANYYPVWPVHPEINNMITVYKRSE